MHFRILGPLEVVGPSGAVRVPAGSQRAVLGRLLLERDLPVSVDNLIADLWREDPPDSASVSVRVQISRLRKLLGEDRIRTEALGYQFVLIEDDDVDSDLFEALVAQ